MTEAEWLAPYDPTPMLEFLRGKASDRKLRLFACAAAQEMRTHSIGRRKFMDTEPLEMAADTRLPEHHLAGLREIRSPHAGNLHLRPKPSAPPFVAIGSMVTSEKTVGLIEVMGLMEDVVAGEWGIIFDIVAGQKTHVDHAELLFRVIPIPVIGEIHYVVHCVTHLRDIFGNPFRPITPDPSWLTSTVVSLAHGIYADRAFDRLPILADALQDAGCDNADVLDHCRSDGPHVRGCWVVDLVLGKQ
jgi:biotin carboxyl carrier protein